MNILGLAAAVFLAASPVLAQDKGSGVEDKSLAAPRELSAEDREKMRRILEEAGFLHVEIREAATYVVRAQTGDGKQVVMYVNPPGTATDATDAPQRDEFDDIRWRGPKIPAPNAGSTIEGYGAE
jgi:hypothetical protein